MQIAALQKINLSEIPGKLAAVFYLKGCNWRCPWCPTNRFDLPTAEKIISLKKALKFLKDKKGELDAVVLDGGEPTIHKDLPKLCAKIKKLGFYIKLNTNGSNPKMLERLIRKKLIDFVALDIKSSKENYPQAIGLDNQAGNYILKKIEEAVALLKKNRVDYVFTTPLCPDLQKQDIRQIVKWLKGAKKYRLKEFVNNDRRFGRFNEPPGESFYKIQQAIAPFFDETN